MVARAEARCGLMTRLGMVHYVVLLCVWEGPGTCHGQRSALCDTTKTTVNVVRIYCTCMDNKLLTTTKHCCVCRK